MECADAWSPELGAEPMCSWSWCTCVVQITPYAITSYSSNRKLTGIFGSLCLKQEEGFCDPEGTFLKGFLNPVFHYPLCFREKKNYFLFSLGFAAVIKHWPRLTCRNKGLCRFTGYSPSSRGVKEEPKGAWSRNHMRSAACWHALHGLLSLHPYIPQGHLPRVEAPTWGWVISLPSLMEEVPTDLPTPVWWRH